MGSLEGGVGLRWRDGVLWWEVGWATLIDGFCTWTLLEIGGRKLGRQGQLNVPSASLSQHAAVTGPPIISYSSSRLPPTYRKTLSIGFSSRSCGPRALLSRSIVHICSPCFHAVHLSHRAIRRLLHHATSPCHHIIHTINKRGIKRKGATTAPVPPALADRSAPTH
jgi:hypothetical protein